MSDPTPYTPFHPVDPDTFTGHPMPATVPDGLRLELGRAKLLDGKEARFDEWMQTLTDRYDECVATLPAERAVFEATFKHTEADGSVWMYHLSLIGKDGGGLDTSNPVDAAHEDYARRTKERGWEELTPKFMLAPDHLRDAMADWGRTGTAVGTASGTAVEAGNREESRTTLVDLNWPKRTERLVLRPVERADLDAMWDYRRLESVARWMSGLPTSRDELARKVFAPDRMNKTLVIECGGTVIGDLMLDVADAWSQVEVADRARGVHAELGWCLHPDHAGQGYATEAVRELIRIAFDDLGLRRLEANCFAANEPSWRLMERVGMRREARMVGEALHRSGEWCDPMMYAILSGEWRAATDTAREPAEESAAH